MRYIKQINDYNSDRDSAVTLGKFDGLHRGHQKLIKEIKDLQNEGMQGIVFTIAPEQIPVLMTPEEKADMIREKGMDTLIRCPFVPEILSMEPEQFISEILVEKLKAKYIVVGTDFRFGHNRKGDVPFLYALQKKYGYEVRVIEKERFEGRDISSTYIKEALRYANISLVNNLLGYEYSVKGIVCRGKQLGRTIGMPTINLIPQANKLLPPCGVYYSKVFINDKEYPGITNIGYKPTVDGSFLGVETYLYGAQGNLYDCEVDVRLLEFRRSEMKFDSVDDLKSQMEQDIQAGKEYFHVR